MGGGEAAEDDQLGGARWTSADASQLTLRMQRMTNVTFETVMICYCTKQAPVFLAGVEISADTNFNRINVICDEDEQ